MRRPELLLLIAASAVLLAGCSRLTFVKPSADRRGMDQVAPEYRFKETDASRKRGAARRHIAAADQQLRAGQLAAAEGEAQAALKADATLPESHTAMAMVSARLGRSEQAGRHFAEAAKLGPSGSTYNNYGAWLCGDGRAEESLKWFDDALGDPNYGDRASALANAGTCAITAGRSDRVERDLRAALELDPANLVALFSMADLQFREGRFLEARAFSERRLAAAPATADALSLASRIEERLGDQVAANRYRQRLRAEFPQAAHVLPGESRQP